METSPARQKISGVAFSGVAQFGVASSLWLDQIGA
jgi:hypothetical protein